MGRASLQVVLSGLPPPQKRLLALALLAGASYGGVKLRVSVRAAQREQSALCAEADSERGVGPGNNATNAKGSALQRARRRAAPRVAVDAVFARRLLKIMKLCVPSPFSAEAGLIAFQGLLLVSRTLLTDQISRIEARAGRHLIAQTFGAFGRGLAAFAGVAVPAAAVNAGLKLFQKEISLAIQGRLTRHLHAAYSNNRAYYSASVLGGLTGADQRITEDVEKFCACVSELYSYTFKPLLDVILFTRSLARIMGYKGQLALYGYYFLSAAALRRLSPPLAAMTAQEAALSGAFRAAHARLVGSAEEVAFNDPPSGASERMILDRHLARLLRHGRLSAFQRFAQQLADGYLVKYAASVVAMLVYAAPLYVASNGGALASKRDRDDVTQDYIRSMRLLQNTSRGVGDLVLVYKRVTTLAGHTSRVAELLEAVGKLASGDALDTARDLYLRNVSSSAQLASQASGKLLGSNPSNLALAMTKSLSGSIPLGELGVRRPRRLRLPRGAEPAIRFDSVALDAPDGTPLVRGLTFDVAVGKSVMVMGPNGSGKSSLLRVLAGLWPLQRGTIESPADPDDVFYLSQRPHLIQGTLRDQLLYPLPPRGVWRQASPASRVEFGRSWTPSARARAVASMPPKQMEERLEAALDAVGLDYLLTRIGGNGGADAGKPGAPVTARGWDQVQPWTETLSGGEKQRLAMARLLFHAPRFAVLDECTSAVSADGERELYAAAAEAGITTLSVAHRPALKKYHALAVHFDGSQTGLGYSIEKL